MNVATRASAIEQQPVQTREPSIYVGYVESSLNGGIDGEYFYLETYPHVGPYSSIRLSREEMIHLREGINNQLGVKAAPEAQVTIYIPEGTRWDVRN